MEFKLNTHELQLVVIALIHGKYCKEDASVTAKYPQDMDRLINLFAELNRMTKLDDGYTITLTAG